MIPIQKTSKEVYAYIFGYYQIEGYMPTLQEIADHFALLRGRKYTAQWAHIVIKYLEKQGKVKVDKKKSRGIELT